ncbi:MAG TPA: hypothetical protein VFE46_16370 [Pirellulales bacterium]|jgi:hypothetical protein|nr:hypothetical protein [Pirellulales bacterium]
MLTTIDHAASHYRGVKLISQEIKNFSEDGRMFLDTSGNIENHIVPVHGGPMITKGVIF